MKSLALHLSSQELINETPSEWAPPHIGTPVEKEWEPKAVTVPITGLLHLRPLPQFATALHRVFRNIPHVHPIPAAVEN